MKISSENNHKHGECVKDKAHLFWFHPLHILNSSFAVLTSNFTSCAADLLPETSLKLFQGRVEASCQPVGVTDGMNAEQRDEEDSETMHHRRHDG